MAVDFLPLCDLLFNLISVTTYFCDLAFDIIVTYTLYEQSVLTQNSAEYRQASLIWFCVLALAIIASVLICQILSLKWYLSESPIKASSSSKNVGHWTSIGVHFCLCGVLWRYARLLFAPIDIAKVKLEMRNLSILRMVHGFLQAAVCLMVQAYVLVSMKESESLYEHRAVYQTAASLSLANMCWAIASFNKHIKSKDIHKLILTWIGVIFQFLWRSGVVAARCIAMVLYASVYHAWIFLFAFLHWTCMITWIIFQKNPDEVEDDENSSENSLPREKRHFNMKFILKSLLLSHIYMFDFVNLEESSTKLRIFLYYLVVLIENLLLVSLWSTNIETTLIFSWSTRRDAFLYVTLLFFAGLTFMLIYYKVFHVSKTQNNANVNGINNPAVRQKMRESASANACSTQTVFNCTLKNPAVMKKRKKIPRVIPPPPTQKPFWKEPLPNNTTEGPNDNGGVYGADDADLIRQKLEEKRRKEAEQLREIQTMNEEFRRRNMNDFTTVLPNDDMFARANRVPFSHDSSGEQGDIDSDADWISRSPPPSYHTYEPPTYHNDYTSSYLPELVLSSNASRVNGKKAETQL